MQNKTQQGIKEIVRLGYETENHCIAVNEELYKQGEKIDNIHNKNKQITHQLVKAEYTTNKLTSRWFRWKEAIKDLVIPNKFRTKYKNSKEEGSNPSIQADPYQEHQHKFKTQPNQKYTNEVDEGLDEAIMAIQRAKKQAQNTGKYLEKQKNKLQNIDSQMDKNNDKINNINHKLKKKFL